MGGEVSVSFCCPNSIHTLAVGLVLPTPSAHFHPGRITFSVINSVHARCIVKTSGIPRGVCKNRGFYYKFKGFLVEFQGAFVKIGDLIKFKGFLVEFS